MLSKQQRIFITFFLSKARLNVNGLAPIVCRVSLNGKRWDVRLGDYIRLEEWHETNSRVKGSSAASKNINSKLEQFEDDCINVFNRLKKIHSEVTLEHLKIGLANIKKTHPEQIIAFWRKENEKMKGLIGKEYAVGTVKNYNEHCNVLEKYLQVNKYNGDVNISAINIYFIEQLNYYLRMVKGYSKNTAVKFQRNLSKILNIAVNYDLILKNPYDQISLGYDEVDRPYLNEEELQLMVNAEFNSTSLRKSCDFFLFSCFTGLSYIDAHNLQKKNLIVINDRYWIKTRRQKTNTQSNIPILEIPLQILKKYNNLSMLKDSDSLLPKISNQKINERLKEIARELKIEKPLSFHSARHTFATTVTLQNGVPIESVSKMLGHKSIKTTQIYARIVDKKIEEDMDQLSLRIESKFGQEQITRTI